MSRKATFVLFVLLNFSALGISRWVMIDGLQSEWYASQNKAPWTPPAWAFGVAWSTIMICFAVYATKLWSAHRYNLTNTLLHGVLLLLCIAWNACFFAYQEIVIGAFVLATLALLTMYMTWYNRSAVGYYSLFMVPFIAWTGIATSLNIYSVFYN